MRRGALCPVHCSLYADAAETPAFPIYSAFPRMRTRNPSSWLSATISSNTSP
jgi:hypothetical protein